MSAAWFSLKWRFVDIRGRHVCNFKGISMTKKTHKNSNPFNLVLKNQSVIKKEEKKIFTRPAAIKIGESIGLHYIIFRDIFQIFGPYMPRRKLPKKSNIVYAFSKNSHQMVVYISRAFQHLLKKYMDFDHVSNLSDLFILTVPCWLQILYVGRSQ